MNKPDKLHVSWDQNPAVRDALGDSKPGDKFTLELHLQVDAINPDGADFTIEAAVPEGYELNDTDENAGTPGDPMPEMSPVGLVVKKATKKPASPPASKIAVPPSM